MKELAQIMKGTEGWGNCWWNNKYNNAIINHAHKLGLVHRTSTTQVHWTEKGVSLYRKYIQA